MKIWFALCMFVVSSPVAAQNIHSSVPDMIDPSATYLFYLHGRIVEDLGPRPIDPRFGLYDYPAVLEALASRGATVISSRRQPETNVKEYAAAVVTQVETLIERGAPPTNIVVAGFSKGGDIAIHVSSSLHRPQVRFILLAACWPRPDEPQLRLTGQVLSIYETSDTLAGESCESLARHPEKPQSFEEISISTGLSHGAFYRPIGEWLDPVLDWVHCRDQAIVHNMGVTNVVTIQVSSASAPPIKK